MLKLLTAFRKELHKYPELSGQEENTAKRVQSFLNQHAPPDRWIENVGGHGLVAIYDHTDDGPTIMIRCELDALPIIETNDFEHQSLNHGVSHKCGHDGHISMVVGIALRLKNKIFDRGRIALLFQPAEETGRGAHRVCNDQRFKELRPDCIFALHNIPGRPLHSISIVHNYFSATVQSFAVQVIGKESHAAEPHNGINPAASISQLISKFSELNHTDPLSEKYSVLTPVYINMGSKNYGISPGMGELHFTIRTWSVIEMNQLKNAIEGIVNDVISSEGLAHHIRWFEYFPSAENDKSLNQLVSEVAEKNGFNVEVEKHPFKFGEDFGWFSDDHKVCMYGLGSGNDCPSLHHADYDFPDELLPTGIAMFTDIIETYFSLLNR